MFQRAWAARRRYREQQNARAYLLRIADRLACDQRRSQRQVNLDQSRLAAARAVEPGGRTVAGRRLGGGDRKAYFGHGPIVAPCSSAVLLLRYYGQLSFAEIAEIIGCPLNTALSHCRRGLETLRKLLLEEEP